MPNHTTARRLVLYKSFNTHCSHMSLQARQGSQTKEREIDRLWEPYTRGFLTWYLGYNPSLVEMQSSTICRK